LSVTGFFSETAGPISTKFYTFTAPINTAKFLEGFFIYGFVPGMRAMQICEEKLATNAAKLGMSIHLIKE